MTATLQILESHQQNMQWNEKDLPVKYWNATVALKKCAKLLVSAKCCLDYLSNFLYSATFTFSFYKAYTYCGVMWRGNKNKAQREWKMK